MFESMFATKNIIKNHRKVKFAILITKLSDFEYKIDSVSYSRNGKDFIWENNMTNKYLTYKISKTFGVYNKLTLNNKLVKTREIGSVSWYIIDDTTVIPCSLIDEAIEMF